MNNSTEQKPNGVKHVVIVGGGFAGLNCARQLAAHPNLRITLLDKNNYQQFQPLLYQVATAILSPSNIAFNLRGTLKGHPSVDVKVAEVVSVDPNTRTVQTATGQQYQGDFLVLAAGSQANFFGTAGAVENSYPLYSLRDAERLRSRILAMLECADRDPSLIAKGALNFVIVGCGPTGTEMAGAFGDMMQAWLKRKANKKEFEDLAANRAQVLLVDAGNAVLSAFSPKAQKYAAKMLKERGVEIRFGTKVKQIGNGHVELSDGVRIPTHTVIWAGGLKAASLSNNIGIKTGHGGRIDVEADLTVPGLTGVYALGDFANIAGKDGKPLPQLASVAEQSGKWCARNIVADTEGKPRDSFRYFDKGIMAMIGRNSGVAEVGEHRHELQGAVAFAAWIGVHAALLTSMRSKVEAFVEWAWDYFGKSRGDAILDQPQEMQIDWNDDSDPAPPAAAASGPAGKASSST
ncbi:MAG: NAD(P)/FAD-dependent oxidoreductase [Candidatus Korobacteraceae bacterium]